MIEVKVRFFTTALAGGKGEVRPKHAWTSGEVRMHKNAARGIIPGSPRHFNSLMEIPAVIERVLIESGVRLHPDSKMKKYIEA